MFFVPTQVGLSRLFVAHGDEGALVAEDVALSVDMGTFLQVREAGYVRCHTTCNAGGGVRGLLKS